MTSTIATNIDPMTASMTATDAGLSAYTAEGGGRGHLRRHRRHPTTWQSEVLNMLHVRHSWGCTHMRTQAICVCRPGGENMHVRVRRPGSMAQSPAIAETSNRRILKNIELKTLASDMKLVP